MDKLTERELMHYRRRAQRQAEKRAANYVAKTNAIASGKVIPLYEHDEITGRNYKC